MAREVEITRAALAAGLKDEEGLRLKRSEEYARWRWQGVQEGLIAALGFSALSSVSPAGSRRVTYANLSSLPDHHRAAERMVSQGRTGNAARCRRNAKANVSTIPRIEYVRGPRHPPTAGVPRVWIPEAPQATPCPGKTL